MAMNRIFDLIVETIETSCFAVYLCVPVECTCMLESMGSLTINLDESDRKRKTKSYIMLADSILQ